MFGKKETIKCAKCRCLLEKKDTGTVDGYRFCLDCKPAYDWSTYRYEYDKHGKVKRDPKDGSYLGKKAYYKKIEVEVNEQGEPIK